MTKEQIKEKIKIKKWELDNWWTDQKYKAKRFWDENKEYIVVLAPVVIASGEKIIKSVRRDVRLKEERDLKEKYIYDMSLKCYYEMRRKPTTKEYLEIERRKKSGEPLGKILANMRLLK